jgi:hypothetical protein
MNRTSIQRPILHTLALATLLLSVGCGGGGGGDGGGASVTATETVTTYYASGRIKESGQVLAGTATRTGSWVLHHDVEGSPLQWRGSYRENAIDTGKPWTEWNVDGSVRDAAGDR